MKKYIVLFTMLWVVLASFGQGYKKAYALFDNNGRELDFDDLIRDLSKAQVVFVGEVHNCSMTHWLELEIAKALYAVHKERLTMGMEMLEADNQLILDEYMHGVITSDRFEDEAKLWPNYATDYAPIVMFAKENHIPFVATNVPRRYANVVKNKGLKYLDSLSVEAKKYIAPLPVKFTYDKKEDGMFAMMNMMGGKKASSNPENMAAAQAIKDATMGWFIARNCKSYFLHFNGNYHSDMKEGIIPYLLQYRPGTTFRTICSVRQEDISRLDEENKGRADYYICVPEDMHNSY